MGWDGGTLRVICLVAAAVSAGYLWRAALEDDSELGRLLDTSPPATVQPGAEPPTTAPSIRTARPPDRVSAVERPVVTRADPVRAKPVVRRQKRPKSVLVVNRPGPAATTPSAAPQGAAAAPKKAPKGPKGTPGTGGKTGTTKNPGGQREEPSESGPAGGPAPATEPTPTVVPPDSSPGEPLEPAEPPALLPAPQPAETLPPTQALIRPGWGHGDKNHDHAGPPGQAKVGSPRR